MGGSIDVKVGKGGASKHFRLDGSVVFASSRYLASLHEPRKHPKIYLETEDPIIFDMFRQWLDVRWGQEGDIRHDEYLQEPWLSRTAEAWVLARKLQAPEFAEFCLERFLRNCALAPLGPWQFIEKNSERGSPLRRFSDHWVAWNVHLLHGEAKEYEGLEAQSYAAQIADHVGDPRHYDYVHWYSDCADLLFSRCQHNPKVREEEARRVQEAHEDDIIHHPDISLVLELYGSSGDDGHK